MSHMISATLRERADGDIHIERLLSAVHTGARRRRRWRLAATAACVVVTVAALVDGAPVATFTPTVIGSDPSLFHLDVTGLDRVANPEWSSRTGYEDLQGFSADAGGEFLVEVAQARDKLTGQPGEIGHTKVNGVDAESVRVTVQASGGAPAPNGHTALRWEAAPSAWVQVVVTGDLTVAMRLAERVRLDRTFRCAVPFRLTGLDTKVKVVKCQTWFHGSVALGGVWLINGPQQHETYAEYYVGVGKPDPAPVPTETIGDRPVAIQTPAGEPARIVYPYVGGAGYFYPFFAPLDDPFLRSLVPAFQPVTDTDPENWPRSPLT
jgi:hypothetical protein